MMKIQDQINGKVCRFAMVSGLVFCGLFFSSVVESAEVVAIAGNVSESISPGAKNANHGDKENQKQTQKSEHEPEYAVPSLNPLELVSETAIWSLVVFLLVFGILGKFAFKPIAKALDERETNIAEKIASAQRANDDAKGILQQYQDKLDKSKEEVRQILDNARRDADRVAAEIVAKARESAVQERERATKEIEAATTFALQKIAEQSATLATNLAGKIIHAEIKPEHHRDLIRGTLDKFVNVKKVKS
ncbi:MAG: F0F1 ATP synthase subunit B [Planctomycetaceae bacterium]|jgi:F-type H+-transporting ATPase subunit b|nr:F0F1 ATP synthase subunit B [Planctomycetaceae bacterium]